MGMMLPRLHNRFKMARRAHPQNGNDYDNNSAGRDLDKSIAAQLSQPSNRTTSNPVTPRLSFEGEELCDKTTLQNDPCCLSFLCDKILFYFNDLQRRGRDLIFAGHF